MGEDSRIKEEGGADSDSERGESEEWSSGKGTLWGEGARVERMYGSRDPRGRSRGQGRRCRRITVVIITSGVIGIETSGLGREPLSFPVPAISKVLRGALHPDFRIRVH